MTDQLKDFSIDRSRYDEANKHSKSRYTAKPGLSKELIHKISADKQEPEWMLQKRLKALELFEKTPMPNWGPDLPDLNFDKLIYYIDPDTREAQTWEDVPEDIRATFDKLGIPEAEKQALSGVGAQYDSSMVYHNLKEEWKKKGIIFENMDIALQKYPELVRKYFMNRCVPITDHKFIMLHAAVWSGGTFIYIPPNVKLDIPLQAYFRMNAKGGGQFEHTLIIADKGSELHYIEGCFTKGNKVETKEGAKSIESIKKGEYVLSHTGAYHKVTNTFKHFYTGNLYDIEIYSDSTQNITATFEHPILCVKRQEKNEKNSSWKKEWVIPEYIKKGDYLCIPRKKEVQEKETRTFPIKKYLGKNAGYTTVQKRVKTNKAFFTLIGFYLAEGSISKGSYLNFSFSTKEGNFIEEVKGCMKEVFGIEKSYEAVHEKNNGVNLVFSSVELCRIFEIFGKSANSKKLPSWVEEESPEKQKALLKAYWQGDGNIYSKRTGKENNFKEVVRTNTISPLLAKQIRDMYIRLGVPAFLNKRDRSKEGRQTMYTIGISGYYLKEVGNILGLRLEDSLNNKKRASMFHIDEEYMYVPVKKISLRTVTQEQVYNLEVEKTQTYTVGSVVVHNCSAPVYSVNSLHAGCVELFAEEGAKIRYSSIENWSKNTYNLNTKRAILAKDAHVDWVNGNLGSGRTMLYPASVLVGENSHSESLGIAFATKGQHQDTGAKMIHVGKNTSSIIRAKSISKDSGISSYRGLVKVNSSAKGAKVSVECDALLVDEHSVSNTYPNMDIGTDDATVAHEAKVGKISEEDIYYLMARGLSEEQAKQMIVSGFVSDVVKQLPLEYAIELNKLIELEMEDGF
ncbi:SufD family Fe-S cluster assembly protein [Candidatus Woesearchaeota archaeon]|nr:SufD family Fe-S cluster assembly protein [Nanoarchaeota archaeon]MCB9370319.1 SufD family Fe-S cluster assembly protein [Candidatus Woesearchaeota archaeon]USN44841.1 MAG: SufD family Fe-S cluster assembly protein [Candidatus Woesearchaeota archaeon]